MRCVDAESCAVWGSSCGIEAQSDYYARKGRKSQAMWTFSAAPASVSVGGPASGSDVGRWNVCKGEICSWEVCAWKQRAVCVIRSASAVVAPFTAVRGGPGTWEGSALHRPADDRSKPQTKEAPALVAQCLTINSPESFQLLFLAWTSLSICSRKAVSSFHQSNYTDLVLQQGTKLSLK